MPSATQRGIRPRSMMSRKTIQAMNVAALLLLAGDIALSGFHLFRSETLWIEYFIIGLAVLLSVTSAAGRLHRRAARKRVIKASRATLLKHVWELRHRREW